MLDKRQQDRSPGVLVSYDIKLRLYHTENGKVSQDFKRDNMVRYAFKYITLRIIDNELESLRAYDRNANVRTR